MKKILFAAALSFALPFLAGAAPVPHVMSGGNYSENFADIANWANDFTGGIGAAPWGSVAINAAGTIPDGTKTTVSTATFVTGGSGGVQKGSGNIVLLTTGTSDNTSAGAIDLFLDFTGRNAGTLSFAYAEINNGSGDRAGSVRVYTSTDGTTFTELAAAAVLNLPNTVPASGNISAVALPAAFNGSATARIRFYYSNGTGGTSGSRPKISIDDVVVTSTGNAAPAIIVPPASRTNYTGETATFTVTVLDGDGYRWFHDSTLYTNGGNVAGATTSTLTLTNLLVTDAATNITVIVSNAFGFATSTPPATLTVTPAPQTALTYLTYNLKGNGATNWTTNAVQVQAIGRQLVYLNADIITFNEIPNGNVSEMTNWVTAYMPGYYLATNSAGDGFIRSVIASRFPILSSATHLHSANLNPFGYSGSFARDLFEAEVSVPGFPQPLHVFVAHLKATTFPEQDNADKRAAEAAAVSNYFVTTFLAGTNGSRPYILSGDMNEDILRPGTNDYVSGLPIQKLVSTPTGLRLTTPTNPVTGDDYTLSIQSSLNVRFDYILPCGILYSNLITSQVFRSDRITPVPPNLNTNDSKVASDHLPVVMLFQNPYANNPASVVTPPVSRTNNLGTTATFSVLATGATPLTYQWRKNGVNLTDNGTFFGVTNSLLTISNVSQLEEGPYSVVVSNAYGMTNSTDAFLTVVTPAETITLWDFNSVIPDATSTTGNTNPVTGSGAATLVGGATATFAGGATADPAASDNTAWNSAGYPAQGTGNKTRGVQFAVSTVGRHKIFISYYEQHSATASRYMRFQYSTNGTDFIDSDVSTFTVSGSFQLQQHDLAGVPGVANNPSFAFRIVSEFESTAATNGNANYVATSSTYGTAGTVRFDLMSVEGEPLVAPGVTAPQNVVTQSGSTVFFSVTATGTAPFGYQWRKGGANLADGGAISGATSATLSLSNVGAADAAGYSVVVTNVAGSVTSSVATLTVDVSCGTLSLGGLDSSVKAVAYADTITTSGGTAPYTYAITAGALPAGLTLNTNTGTVSGIPTANYGSYTFTILATDANGCTGTNDYTLLVNKKGGDTVKPTVKFSTAIKNNSVVTSAPPLVVTGTAADAVLVTNVQYWVNAPTNTPPSVASGTTAWSLTIPAPVSGVYTVIVQSVDLSGNLSTPATLKFNYGTNSFLGLAGTYYGLFSETSGVKMISAGFAKVKVTAKPSKLATFSVNLTVDGKKWAGAGTFGMEGVGTLKKPIDRNAKQPGKGFLTTYLTLPFDGSGTLGGSVINSTNGTPDTNVWTAVLDADLAVLPDKTPTAGTNYDGTYTLVVPSTGADIGDGFGLLIITNGTVKLVGGKLADNQNFKQTGLNLSQTGDWPLFSVGDKVSGIYNSMLMGWVSVATNQTITAGSLVWIKTGIGALTYPAGFATNVTLEASTYGDPGATLVLPLGGGDPAPGVVALSNGGLLVNVNNSVSLGIVSGKNKFFDLEPTAPNKLKLALTPKTGKLASPLKAVTNGVPMGNIYGVVMTNQLKGRGFFLPTGGTSSGTFKLE